ncbi:MAG: hypothetical protein EZS28_016818 [Streblomastix strix]|uniref:Uncharacterized protein n=1 Tax=Streblomastix strix TaxID=222440 RepID=A0A5J4VYB4_9EUKA|nr:MAG: hypothetical protein EZS28_016818 [Streblomastix strix]
MIRCLPTNLTDIDVYHLIRKWITGGLSNVMHRVNRSGIDFIKRIQYDKVNKKVTVLTTDHRITHVVGVDFNSLYPSVMSSEPHQFIKYTNVKMYMSGSQTDINRLHFIEGDTDSAYWAISGNPKEDFTQGDVYDEKKILGLAIERQGAAMVALAPKNVIFYRFLLLDLFFHSLNEITSV